MIEYRQQETVGKSNESPNNKSIAETYRYRENYVSRMENLMSFVDVAKCTLCSVLHNNHMVCSCGHTFCKSCTDSLADDTLNKTDNLTCPKCKMSMHVISFISGSENETSTNHCSVCSLKGETTPCSYRCADCLDLLCSDCAKGHSASSSTVSHKVVSLGSALEEPSTTDSPVSRKIYCVKHIGEEISFYCKTCKELLCMRCALFEHVKHERTNLQEEKEKAKERIHSIIKERTISLANLESERERTLEKINYIEKLRADAIQKLTVDSDDIINKILTARSLATQQINAIFTEHQTQVTAASEMIHSCEKLARDTLITCTNALSGSDIELIMLYGNLEEELTGVHEAEESLLTMGSLQKPPIIQIEMVKLEGPFFTLRISDPSFSGTHSGASTDLSLVNHLAENDIRNSCPGPDNVYTNVEDTGSFALIQGEKESTIHAETLIGDSKDALELKNDNDRNKNENKAELSNIAKNESEPFFLKETDEEKVNETPCKKKIYVPKGFYKLNKPTKITQNHNENDDNVKSDVGTAARLNNIPKSLSYEDTNTPTTEDSPEHTGEPTDDWSVALSARASPSYSDAVKKSKINGFRPKIVPPSHYESFEASEEDKADGAEKVWISHHLSFDTTVKRDEFQVIIKGLCFFEDDRILVTDLGNGKLKNLLKDGKQPHNRQLKPGIEPERIAAINRDIALISENVLYIITKDADILHKLLLSDEPPEKDSPFSFSLTTLNNEFLVGNLPGNKLKTYHPKTGKKTSEMECKVKTPIAAVTSTDTGRLLMCSWHGRGSVHLVDVDGKEYRKFVHTMKSKERWKPNDACSDSYGYVYATDYARNEIDIFNADGAEVVVYSTTRERLQGPHCLILDKDYKLYVSGEGGNIVVYSIVFG